LQISNPHIDSFISGKTPKKSILFICYCFFFAVRRNRYPPVLHERVIDYTPLFNRRNPQSIYDQKIIDLELMNRVLDCDSVLTADDCDDNDANSTVLATDAYCDSVLTADDCDDNDSNSTTISEDADCDGSVTANDCNDNDENSTIISEDADCDGTLTADDCNDLGQIDGCWQGNRNWQIDFWRLGYGRFSDCCGKKRGENPVRAVL